MYLLLEMWFFERNCLVNANSFKRLIFTEFLTNKRLIQRKNYDYISAKDDQILTIVAMSYANGKRLSVSDLLNNKIIGSRSSVHSRIQRLRQLNLIEYKTTEDIRRFQVCPTEKLLRYFDKLGNMIVKLNFDSK